MISGVYDLAPVQKTYVQKILNLSDKDVLDFSLTRIDKNPSFPCIVAVGGNESDEFVRQSEELYIQWRDSSTPCNFVTLEGYNHFTVLDCMATDSSVLSTAIIKQMKNIQ